jgi:hypothetical protein|tara:strand:- start:1398 stop:1607 length:210 start_codon:yes stop_codon:yes gene_type:complete
MKIGSLVKIDDVCFTPRSLRLYGDEPVGLVVMMWGPAVIGVAKWVKVLLRNGDIKSFSTSSLEVLNESR